MQKQDLNGYRTPLDVARRYKLEKEKVLKVADDGSIAEVVLKGDAKDGSKITLKADQIDLKGKNINLTGDDVTISSTNFNVSSTGVVTASSLALTGGSITLGNNFSVDSSGNMTCNNANVSGTINATGGTIAGNMNVTGTLNGGTINGANINTSNDITIGNNLYVGQNQTPTPWYSKYIYFNENSFLRRLVVGNGEKLELHSYDSSVLSAGNNTNGVSAGVSSDRFSVSRQWRSGDSDWSASVISYDSDFHLITLHPYPESSSQNGTVQIFGNLSVNGTKNRVVKTKNYGERLLNAYETSTPYFGDLGSGKTDKKGKCKIKIDKIFKETIELSDYKVFVQELDDGKLYVSII